MPSFMETIMMGIVAELLPKQFGARCRNKGMSQPVLGEEPFNRHV
jgi:hypothetical protein